MNEIKWGPSGEIVYNRTYSRKKLDGTQETWFDTVERVVAGNLGLVNPRHHLPDEQRDLVRLMREFKILPGGRHLWMSGVPGRQFLFNCHVSGWTENIEDHFSFTFLRLMEGGGVGSNYTQRQRYMISRETEVYIVCDPSHPDYEALKNEGLLTDEFSSDWTGSIEVEDSREGWDEALRDLLRASTSRTKHAKRVYDVSRVRWKGARIKSFGGTASGPVHLARMLLSVGKILNRRYRDCDKWDLNTGCLTALDAMEIDHEIATCVVSGGIRRSARMSILHWNDPEIHAFLACKEDTSKHWTTNISVAIDQEFIDLLGEEFPVIHQSPNEIRVIAANMIYDKIVRGMLTTGEPGIWNIELSNEDEPNFVEATNPCGEITMEAWENCNLGHVNLDAFADEFGTHGDDEELLYAHALMTRFLIRATYGDITDARQQEVVARNRRIGVGHFGFAGFVAKLGIAFSESWESCYVASLLSELAREVKATAGEYARELRIPAPVKHTTVAPTGTIAKMPGRTEGIHPVMYKYFIRRIRFSTIHEPETRQLEALEASGYCSEPDQQAPDTWVVEIPTKESLVEEVDKFFAGEGELLVESSDEISLFDMLSVQAMYQENYADNAVSFTINLSKDRYSLEEVKETLLPFLSRLKGTTIFPEVSRPQSPYERISKEEYDAYVAKTVADSVDEDCASGACPVR